MDEIINRKNIGFSAYVNKVTTKKAIFNTLGEKRALTFITAIISSVTNNEALQKCNPQSIISGALLGESLNLSSSVQLGQYYLVPYKNKATFQLGYKGYIQLAMRSGNYRKIISQPIKNGELISYNPLEEEIKLNPILEDSVRENTPTIGYYAMFEYINGFKKSIYWSKTKMQAHAKKYSKSYGSGYSFWDKDFDAMACKTMLRQLISKWGIMSTELQVAYTADQSVINADGSVNYIDSNIVNNYQENRKVVDVL
nr:MAG TPA: RecT protein [Caudoviricetes sp.]